MTLWNRIDKPDSGFAAERRFIKHAMKLPMLSREHEIDLARRWRYGGDEGALHELTSAYLRLVVAVAVRYRNYGLPMADMIQDGSIGLMQAAARFDPEREVRFSTYASWWIRSAMQDYVLRNWSIVRAGTSATQKALFFKLRWLRARIDRDGAANMSEATRAKIAGILQVAPGEIDTMALRLSGRDQSLNEPVGEDGVDEWQDFLADTAPNPEETVIERRVGEVRSRWLQAALSELNPRERQIVVQRKLRDDRITLEEIGVTLGITKERVRQIEHKALAKLRQAVLKLSGEAR